MSLNVPQDEAIKGTITLPQELYGHILTFVFRRKDLRSLSLASGSLYEEATRVLYHQVVLTQNSPNTCSFFQCTSQSPHLGGRIHSLTFFLRHEPLNSLHESIKSALGLMPNLRE
jgi:hypothetical protein